ncbi:PRTRC genetic system protein A [Sphingomonas sp. BE270]|jgi:PRTRC genetic system protein A|uniref:PRTRC system protein A n=1 Tax=Sphingomonas sp. BE270 TaxID=2817726 RepID=UPI002855DFB9|nr:PRTRC system protein A [Sphingomonas sp. BE270]MDR7256268.1 PRTRC genetic system protein A [Sphingomonas sp. BE270]
MSMLADDPTAAAVLAAVPCYPVPPNGRSPGIDALRAARAGHGLAIGKDGVMLILRRPWLALDVAVTPPICAYVPFGSTGELKADLRCGLIPHEHLISVLDHFRAALPNEAAAFVIWNEATKEFALHFPAVDEATPSRLVYRTPVLPPDWHVVCDIHSHGAGPAYFSATDDADDAFATKISLVFGRLGQPDGPMMASRLCAGGMFLPIPRSPFLGDYHAV